MNIPFKPVLASFATVSTVVGLVSGAVIFSQPQLPEQERILAVIAYLGADGCISETWQVPAKYPTINHYLKEYPDAKPALTLDVVCEMRGLPTDIQSDETFDSYNSMTFDYPVIVN